MRVSCPHCGASGTLRDDRVPEAGKEVTCPRCRSRFLVGKEPAKSSPSAVLPGGPSERKVPVRCPACGVSGSIPAARLAAGGSVITCPKCQTRFSPEGGTRPAPDASEGGVAFACPQCGRKGRMPASLVPEGGTGTNCPKCNARFFVRRAGEPPAAEPARGPAVESPVFGEGRTAAAPGPGTAGLSAGAGTGMTEPVPSYFPNTAPMGPSGGTAAEAALPWGIGAEPSVARAVVAGTAAAFIGALVWAFITVLTSYQIGWMAIGVGALVGFAVQIFGGGRDMTFGVVGAGMALFGCAVGNLMAACAFISSDPRNADIGTVSIFFDAVSSPVTATRIMSATFHPLDILFYVLAVTTGYKVAMSGDQNTA